VSRLAEREVIWSAIVREAGGGANRPVREIKGGIMEPRTVTTVTGIARGNVSRKWGKEEDRS